MREGERESVCVCVRVCVCVCVCVCVTGEYFLFAPTHPSQFVCIIHIETSVTHIQVKVIFLLSLFTWQMPIQPNSESFLCVCRGN